MGTQIGQPNAVAMGFFFVFIAITLGITYWAARRTRTTEHFYAAGRTVSPVQNGLALAGDYMSAWKKILDLPAADLLAIQSKFTFVAPHLDKNQITFGFGPVVADSLKSLAS